MNGNRLITNLLGGCRPTGIVVTAAERVDFRGRGEVGGRLGDGSMVGLRSVEEEA